MESNQICRLLYRKRNYKLNEKKKQPTEWDKIFVIDETSRTYFPKYTNNSIFKEIEKWQKI